MANQAKVWGPAGRLKALVDAQETNLKPRVSRFKGVKRLGVERVSEEDALPGSLGPSEGPRLLKLLLLLGRVPHTLGQNCLENQELPGK